MSCQNLSRSRAPKINDWRVAAHSESGAPRNVFPTRVVLLRRKLVLEMTFNIFATKGVFCFGQYDRIDDLITCKLRGDKRPVCRQLLVDKLHISAVCNCFDPLFVWLKKPSRSWREKRESLRTCEHPDRQVKGKFVTDRGFPSLAARKMAIRPSGFQPNSAHMFPASLWGTRARSVRPPDISQECSVQLSLRQG